MKVNYVTSVGVVLIVLALLLPWIQFDLPLRFQLEGEPKNIMVHSFVSPFALTLNFTETSNRTYYSDIATITHTTTYFYNIQSSISGGMLLFGSLLGLVGEQGGRRTLTLLAGTITFFSIILFVLSLPPYVLTVFWNLRLWNILWGIWLSCIGTIIIFISVPFRMYVLHWKYLEEDRPYEVSGYLASG
jgi:hypothetical protein